MNVFINNLDAALNVFNKFSDHSKLGGDVDSIKGADGLQRDSGKLESWAMTRHMKFKKSKC